MSLANFGFQTKEAKQSAFQTKQQQSSKKQKYNNAFAELGFVKFRQKVFFSSRCFLPRHIKQFINGEV